MWHWRLLLVENNKFIWPPAWYTLLKKKKNNSQQKKNGPRVQRYPLMNGDIKAFTSLKNARANLHWGAKYPKMVSSDYFFIWLLVLSAKIQIHYLKRIFLATVTTKFYYLPFAIGYSVAKVKFCQVYFKLFEFHQSFFYSSQLHTTAWNSKVRFPKTFYFSLLENQYKKYVCKPKNSRHFSAKL